MGLFQTAPSGKRRCWEVGQGNPVNPCQPAVNPHPANTHLERIEFLSAAPILENLVTVLLATSRIQRVDFEHRGCNEIQLVRQVATGEWTWMYGPYMSAAKTSEYVYLCELSINSPTYDVHIPIIPCVVSTSDVAKGALSRSGFVVFYQ